MKGYSIMALLMLLLPACCASKDRNHADLAYGIVGKNSREVKKKYGFEVYGTGGCMIDGVQSVFISYSCGCQVNVDEARKLFIDIDEELIKKFNEDEEIRPFLVNYPFTYNNIELDLTFPNSRGPQAQGDYVALAMIVNGNVCYAIYDPQKEGNPLRTIHREPYEEALRIVRESREMTSP